MTITYSIIGTEGEFDRLRTDWNQLLDVSGIANPFLTWEWMNSWWHCYGLKEPLSELSILTAHRGEELQAIFPGYISCEYHFGRRVRKLLFLGSTIESSDYLDIIQRSPANPELVRNILGYLTGEGRLRIDILALHNILETDPLAALTREHAGASRLCLVERHHRICPYVAIRSDWDSYLSSLGKNMRYNFRRRTRKIVDELGGVFEKVDCLSEVDRAIERLFSLHKARFSSKHEPTIFSAETRMEFHKRVSRQFLEKGILRLLYLKMNQEIVAMIYCFEFRNELFYIQAGMDPKWEKYSVGMVLLGHTIQECHEQRLDRFDFMRGDEAYKFSWTQSTRNITIMQMGLTRKGARVLRQEDVFERFKNRAKQSFTAERWTRLKSFLGKSR